MTDWRAYVAGVVLMVMAFAAAWGFDNVRPRPKPQRQTLVLDHKLPRYLQDMLSQASYVCINQTQYIVWQNPNKSVGMTPLLISGNLRGCTGGTSTPNMLN